MYRNYISENPGKVFSWLLAGLLVLLVLIEGWRYSVQPQVESKEQALENTLQRVSTHFLEEQQSLIDETQSLADNLQQQLLQQYNRSQLLSIMQNYSQLWGTALYRDNQPLVWQDFSLDLFPVQPDAVDSTTISIQKNNNVLFWLGQTNFTIQTPGGTENYQLYTSKRIKQTNALPIGDDREFNILEDQYQTAYYSINISIMDPLPDTVAQYRVLHSLADDSVGAAYAIPKNASLVETEWREKTRFWRAAFTLVAFVLAGFFFYLLAEQLPTGRTLFFQLILVGIGWIVFSQINIAENWLPALLEGVPDEQVVSYQQLCNFTVDGLFFLMGAFTLQRKLSTLQYQIQPNSFFSAMVAAAGAGLINMLVIVLTFKSCYSLVFNVNMPMLSLQLFANVGIILVYLVLGIMLLGLTITLIAMNQFLLRAFEDYYKLVAIICIGTYLFAILVAQIFIVEFFVFTWALIISGVYFLLVFGLSFAYLRYPLSLPKLSPLRNAAVYSFVIGIAGATIIYQAKLQDIDQFLDDTIQTYTQQDDEHARQLTQTILTELEQQFDTLTEAQLQDQIAFVQADFTETIEEVIQNKAVQYSFDLQLINREGDLLANYSTNLNSPEWVKAFSLNQLEAVLNIEQITDNNVRPVIQQPDLADGNNYQTFYRGWIPVFGSADQSPTAWILCSVYQERPNFEKPLRAVISALNYQDGKNTYFIQEYTNNKLTTTIDQSAGSQYPTYNVLQSTELEAVQQDSSTYSTHIEENRTYRNLLTLQPDGRIIKSSTLLPGYQTILFSFFRLNFTLLITGFLILVIYQWIRKGEVAFLGRNNQFQYRILDSFLLATLAFLIMLIVVTHYAIQRQNKDLVEKQLFDKLDTITAVAERNPNIQQQLSNNSSIDLQDLTDPLDIDATIYRNLLMSQSTTPQIYQQNLLPNALPYSVYSDLFLSQKRNALKTVKIDKQAMMIGYRSVFSAQDEPIAVIAIPTFVESPQFNKQLLETTSYLIILYLVVFGLFIIATIVISRQLTRPLHHIQQGLNKISRGNLDTTIPATSDDEIGSLAQAYNQMVEQLKELQENLAEAEREAAWKEMAQQVAHEIKNPLTPMKLNIQHLERQLASGDYTIDELKDKIRTITQNLFVQIQSLNNIASDFSKFSKPIDEEFTEVDIDELVQSVAELYANDDQTAIKIQCNASPVIVYGAREELRRVVINLIKNAHEAMPEGGTIDLKTYYRRDSIFIEIEDDGQGISEEDKPKIFVPNFSTKSSGTGLGLAISKKVIEAHEGSISFASIEGKGTTFVIKLPAKNS